MGLKPRSRTADRSEPTGRPTHPAPTTRLTIARFRQPRSVEELTPDEQEQLVACALAWDGTSQSPAELMAGPFGRYLDVYDVEDRSGDVLYQVWCYMVDSGGIFHAGTTDRVGRIIQFHAEVADLELRDDLAAAVAAAELPEGARLPCMRFATDDN